MFIDLLYVKRLLSHDTTCLFYCLYITIKPTTFLCKVLGSILSKLGRVITKCEIDSHFIDKSKIKQKKYTLISDIKH